VTASLWSLASAVTDAAAPAAGLRSKLKKLPSGYVALNINSPDAGRKVLRQTFISMCIRGRLMCVSVAAGRLVMHAYIHSF
jgi:hypothetical protein